MPAPESIKEVVQHGLCIGCGLCESVTRGRVAMHMTDYGALRPATVNQFTTEEEQEILSACPGAGVRAPIEEASKSDLVWGSFEFMRHTWAANPGVRFKGATGGVLTALAQQLLSSGLVKFVLHVNGDPERPLYNRWVISSTVKEVLANSGSRYAPTAPLAGLHQALERSEPFALVGKPCDVSAVNALAKHDSRIDQLCTYRLALVCGGQSRLSKTLELLERFDVDRKDVASISYRGNGNPGPTVLTTLGGQQHTTTYNELWGDESSWDLESRCSLCPDALGEAADIAAADVWPGGGPEGEDDGFNGVVVRTARGKQLFIDAVKSGRLEQSDAITPSEFNHFQPHQVRKKVALLSRFEALTQCGKPIPETSGLRLRKLGEAQSEQEKNATIEGTKRRVKAGRFTEPY